MPGSTAACCSVEPSTACFKLVEDPIELRPWKPQQKLPASCFGLLKSHRLVRQLGIKVLDIVAGRNGATHRNTPPPAGSQRRLIVRHGGLHAGGEEQGESRAARPAGIHFAGRLDPVGQLTGTNERGREKDLAREQAV